MPLVSSPSTATVARVAQQIYAATSASAALHIGQVGNRPAALLRQKGALPWYGGYARLAPARIAFWESGTGVPPPTAPMPSPLRSISPDAPASLSVLAPLRAGLAQIAAATAPLCTVPHTVINVSSKPVDSPLPAAPPARRAEALSTWARLCTPRGWTPFAPALTQSVAPPTPTPTPTPTRPSVAPTLRQARLQETTTADTRPVARIRPRRQPGLAEAAFLSSYNRHMAQRQAKGGIWLGGFFDEAKAHLDTFGTLPGYARTTPMRADGLPLPSPELLHAMQAKRIAAPFPNQLDYKLRRQIPYPTPDLPWPQLAYPCRAQKSELHPYALNRELDRALARQRG